MPTLRKPTSRSIQVESPPQETYFERRYATLLQSFQTEYAQAEERYQQTVARYYQAQATNHAAQKQYQQQYQRLREVLGVKQQVIAVLLPYYPHPVTPELQRQIDLS